MDLEELKTQRPAIYKAALAEGVKRERDRVASHLAAGRKVGDLKTALAAIRSGTEFTPELAVRYMTAGRNRADVLARESDDEAVHAAIDNMKQPESAFGDPFEKAVIDRFEELMDTGAGDANIEDLEEA